MPIYIALIRKEPGSPYWVSIPDLPGCAASGETEDEAKANFAGALQLHLEFIKEGGIEFTPPMPRTRDQVLAAEKHDYLRHYSVEVEYPCPLNVRTL